MPNELSSSADRHSRPEGALSLEIYRDREAIIAALREFAARALERHPELQRVILFGSIARGDYALYSDADLLLVLAASDLVRFFDRISDFVGDFSRAPVPCELFPYTLGEINRMVEHENPLITRALQEGLVLAERA